MGKYVSTVFQETGLTSSRALVEIAGRNSRGSRISEVQEWNGYLQEFL